MAGSFWRYHRGARLAVVEWIWKKLAGAPPWGSALSEGEFQLPFSFGDLPADQPGPLLFILAFSAVSLSGLTIGGSGRRIGGLSRAWHDHKSLFPESTLNTDETVQTGFPFSRPEKISPAHSRKSSALPGPGF